MTTRPSRLAKLGLATLYYTGGHRLLSPLTQGVGAIFRIEHVLPKPPAELEPNPIACLTPAALEEAVGTVRRAGFDIVSLDDLHWRLMEGAFDRPFAAFTFDHGYRNVVDHAYPVLRRLDVPIAFYIPASFPDGRADLWWLALERVIATVDRLLLKMDGEARELACATPAEKSAAFRTVWRWLMGIDEREARRVVRELCRGISYDPAELGELCVDWRDLKRLSEDPLVTIGAAGFDHLALAKLSEAAARAELERGAERIARELGRRPAHLALPYGTAGTAGPREFRLARELGFKTAVTAEPGLVYAGHTSRTTALPRITLDGDSVDLRYMTVLLSGVPFLLANGGRRVLAA